MVIVHGVIAFRNKGSGRFAGASVYTLRCMGCENTQSAGPGALCPHGSCAGRQSRSIRASALATGKSPRRGAKGGQAGIGLRGARRGLFAARMGGSTQHRTAHRELCGLCRQGIHRRTDQSVHGTICVTAHDRCGWQDGRPHALRSHATASDGPCRAIGQCPHRRSAARQRAHRLQCPLSRASAAPRAQ